MRRRMLALFVLVVAALAAAPPAAAEPHEDPSPTAAGASPTAVGGVPEALLQGIGSVENGGYHSCAILTNRQVRCWGYNEDGELGIGNFSNPHPTAVVTRNVAGSGPLQNVVELALGVYHSCALLTNGQVRCWGRNEDGQLGTGDNDGSNLPRIVRNVGDDGPLQNVVRISAENDGTCALLVSRQVRCWGDDDFGQLGNGPPNLATNLPVAVKGVGGTGVLTGIVGLGGGFDNNCAVTEGGQARCWGYQGDGVLGNGAATGNSPVPVVVRSSVSDAPLTGVRQVVVGGHHACARLSNTQARCWGDNGFGELGTGGTNDSTRAVPVRLPSGAALVDITAIEVSGQSSCAALSTGRVRCWGRDSLGQNGDGTIDSPDFRKSPNPVRSTGGGPGFLGGVQGLAGNTSHFCVLVEGGQGRCWGNGGDGQLGNGNTSPTPFPVRVQI